VDMNCCCAGAHSVRRSILMSTKESQFDRFFEEAFPKESNFISEFAPGFDLQIIESVAKSDADEDTFGKAFESDYAVWAAFYLVIQETVKRLRPLLAAAAAQSVEAVKKLEIQTTFNVVIDEKTQAKEISATLKSRLLGVSIIKKNEIIHFAFQCGKSLPTSQSH
jgi:hypothetical protein